MEHDMFEKIRRLRAELHAMPELSGQETLTKARLMRFIGENTSLELNECGGGFYAAHRETNKERCGIAIRADFDALDIGNGMAAHLCGHDGHAAALCGVALMLEGKRFGRDVFLLFQDSEENGSGASGCCRLFEKESVGEIYGAHNLPGVPLGAIRSRRGVFACASKGVELRFYGAPTHAAYPELGISPARAVGRLLCGLDECAEPRRYEGMTLCTVIGVHMGEKGFGSAAANAQVLLTLRAEHDGDLAALSREVETLARELAQRDGLRFMFAEHDVFPATLNDERCAQKALDVCGGEYLGQPMRWSEDFGHYLNRCPGAFLGIGAGTGHAPLHTAGYEYPDALLEPTAEMFMKLIEA